MDHKKFLRPRVTKKNWELARTKHPYIEKGCLVDYIIENYVLEKK